jgi:lipoprotein-anchoring transpeptidase ErfK/SrfK
LETSVGASDHFVLNHHNFTFTTLRAALVSGVALACLVGVAGPAEAGGRLGGDPLGLAAPAAAPAPRLQVARRGDSARRERAEKPKDLGWDVPKGPQQVIVNISTQRVTLYANGARVSQGPVATGMPGHPTPQGVFSIIQKDRYHHSNIYSGAPMPYMQRITWSGVAIHEGPLPGYPASHGCIRTSHEFASKLWPVTQLGVRVIVSRHDVAPTEFSHAKLFVPKPKPAEPQVAVNGATDGANVRLAQVTSPDASNDANATPVETTTPMVQVTPTPTSTTEGAPTGTLTPVQVETTPAPAEVTPAAAAPAPTEAAPADGFVKPAPAIDPTKPAVPRVKGAEQQPQKRAGQVAVFVSRKEKKIFVRQGMVPLFDMPITIDNPDQPLGTHVYTALQITDDGAGMRWNLMTIPTTDVAATSDERRSGRRHSREAAKPVVNVPSKAASSAAEALDRIQFPKEAVDRISEILVPGSSLVVSDTGISGETGKGTDFIVLTR